MRTAVEFALLLGICAAACFGLHYWRTSRPTLVTGWAINLTTGKPVPNAKIRFRTLNASFGDFATGANGYFSAKGIPAQELCIAWADHPRYAGMLQTRFGTSVVLPKTGDHQRNIIVPAIPGGEISGHVFDEAGNPVLGCRVTVSVPEHVTGPPALKFLLDTKTDAQGLYLFENVDADRYYISVGCDKLLRGEAQNPFSGVTSTDWRRRVSWRHVFYPDADSVESATAITVLPGVKRTGMDFHLRAVETFSVRGRFVRAGETPDLWILFSTNFSFRPRGNMIRPTDWGHACDYDANTTRFRCDFIPYGEYRVAISLDPDFVGLAGGDLHGAGKAVGTLHVQVGKAPPELVIQLRKEGGLASANASAQKTDSSALTGTLQVQMNCKPEKDKWTNRLYLFPLNSRSALYNGWYPNCCKVPSVERVSPGTYEIAAYSVDFWRPSAAVLDLIRAHASTVQVRAHQEVQVRVPVFDASDIYHMVLQYLRGKNPN